MRIEEEVLALIVDGLWTLIVRVDKSALVLISVTAIVIFAFLSDGRSWLARYIGIGRCRGRSWEELWACNAFTPHHDQPVFSRLNLR
mgnify:CR=1 FL=1